MKKQLILPTVITEDSDIYKNNPEVAQEYLGRPYLSYSSVTQWQEYKDDFVKGKLGGIRSAESVYLKFGNYVGSYLEHFGNPPKKATSSTMFAGEENLQLIYNNVITPHEHRSKLYTEHFIIKDLGSFVVVGYIDFMAVPDDNRVTILDLKTGGKGAEKKYSKKEYIQTTLYASAIAEHGYDIEYSGVYFVRREGSHFNPPLRLGSEQFYIETPFNKTREKYALNTVTKVAKEIEALYKTYKKVFECE